METQRERAPRPWVGGGGEGGGGVDTFSQESDIEGMPAPDVGHSASSACFSSTLRL